MQMSADLFTKFLSLHYFAPYITDIKLRSRDGLSVILLSEGCILYNEWATKRSRCFVANPWWNEPSWRYINNHRQPVWHKNELQPYPFFDTIITWFGGFLLQVNKTRSNCFYCTEREYAHFLVCTISFIIRIKNNTARFGLFSMLAYVASDRYCNIQLLKIRL